VGHSLCRPDPLLTATTTEKNLLLTLWSDWRRFTGREKRVRIFSILHCALPQTTQKKLEKGKKREISKWKDISKENKKIIEHKTNKK
jgi:hypothetical protein